MEASTPARSESVFDGTKPHLIVRQSMIAEKPLLIEGRADQIHRQRLSFSRR